MRSNAKTSRGDGSDPRRTRARWGEGIAAAWLRLKGYRIEARNWRCPHGELDLVARDGRTLVIVEVRMRSSEEFGGGAASVDRAKQRRIVLTARQLLQQRRDLAALPVRFDVAVVTPDPPSWRIEWIRHAFEAG